MNVKGTHCISVWANEEAHQIGIINQKILPFYFQTKYLSTVEEVLSSIKTLEVRGAPAIGITAAYAVWLSFILRKGNLSKIKEDSEKLLHCRPTAVNLSRGVSTVLYQIENSTQPLTSHQVYQWAIKFAKQEILACYQIGKHGVTIIESLYKRKGSTINILTHCNAGWLACGDYGTALAPIFEAKSKDIPIHCWVDETRPLNQGSRLTAWELYHENIPFSIVSDNMGGLLMMNRDVDCVIVGADRIVQNGDVANKIGTYLKALAAHYNHIPFYVAAPVSTFDMTLKTGTDITLEIRESSELQKISGMLLNEWKEISLFPDDYASMNAAFDITPASLITGYICENGIITDKKQIEKIIRYE